MAARGPTSRRFAPKIVVALLVATTCGSAVVRLVAAEVDEDVVDRNPAAEIDADATAEPPTVDEDAFVDGSDDALPGPRLPEGGPLPPPDLIDDNSGGCGCDPRRPEQATTTLWLGGVASLARMRTNKKEARRR